MKKKSSNQKQINYVAVALTLIIGVAIGYLASSVLQAKPASAQEIENAKKEITKLYKGKTVAACWEVNEGGGNLATDKYELTYRHLRINKDANRAIVTDCGDYDTLLYKDRSGEWGATTVNLQIGNRVNPTWQKECGIEDITVADTVVRSENGSIDEMNLEECKQINQQ